MFLAGMAGFVAAMEGCNLIAGIEEGAPNEATTVCDGALEGTPLPDQIAGDCAELVCDGAGRSKLIPLESDPVDDGDPCTLDACVGTAPQHTLQAEVPCYTGPDGTRDRGRCEAGVQRCDAAGNPVGGCEGEVLPAAETCVTPDDEDCDGEANEEGVGCSCTPGTVVACYTGPAGTADVGACRSGQQSCNPDGIGYSPCVDETHPGSETCDATEVDEDCDGLVNESGPDCTCGDGFVSTGEGESCEDNNTTSLDGCSATCVKEDVVAVALGETHSCALLRDGRVKCWGGNAYGQLGLGFSFNNRVGDQVGEMGANLPAVNLGTGKTAVALAAGDNHTCAVLNDGTLKCWGVNDSGQLGLGGMTAVGTSPSHMGDNLPAVALGTAKTAVAVSAAGEHTCAVLNDGSVKCWGNNDSGQLGLGDTLSRGGDTAQMGDSLPAVALGTGQSAIAVSAAGGHTCVLLNGGSVKCWGYNTYGQLGLGSPASRGTSPSDMGNNLPAVNLGTGKTATLVSAGSQYTCAVLNDGSVKCWGNNDYGQLGLGDTFNRGTGSTSMGDNLPVVNLGTGKTATLVSAGGRHTCAVLNDSTIKCWGYNSSVGQLGLGDTASRGTSAAQMGNNLPAVNLGTSVSATLVDTSADHTCALLGAGNLKCWGASNDGQLGLGDTSARGSSPAHMGDNLPTVKLYTDAF
ncbi:Hypothetical protein CAP_7971 [Chondromyces apiculatus DSM 436]|uniref:RCC1-like domain-containing protein n=1 Tax=Chondromyces apiculatus DSM 436 TaxID=1192034 RepID=A0A017SY21_9BACT|nr:Hypothetical protein CAP_7971 [Chondromyces apiculatus DSM 436]